MNKQEVIEKLQGMKQLVEEGDKGSYEKGFINALTYALNVNKQLDEPEKPVVPKFVADWYEKHKYNLSQEICSFYIDYCNGYHGPYDSELISGFVRWFSDNDDTAIETLVKMKFYGYEVEKEKLYTVKFSNEDFGKMYIGIFKKFNKLGISSLPLNDDEVKSWFIEDELKRFKFWDNPAFEIEEVKK